MNLLLAISETPPHRSGIARIAARLRAGFVADGHRVELLSIDDTGRFSLGEVRLTGLLPRWLALRKRTYAADVVSVHGPVPTFSDMLLLLLWLRRRRHGTPRVVYTHLFDLDFPVVSPLCTLYNWTHRELARWADRVVVSTPSYASSFASFTTPERTTVIPWGVDGAVSVSPSEKSQQLTVLFVGQLRPYKGVDTLIRAARQIPDARVIIAGDGPERERLERIPAESGIRNVEFRGSVSDDELERLYRGSHAVVLPSVSRLEAFGITLLEGMAAGCVPIASALPGVTDVVGDAGFTYPPGDVVALGEHLARLSRDRDEWGRYSERAREHSRQYTWNRTVSGYLALFESVMQESGVGESEGSETTKPIDELPPGLRSWP